MNKRWIEENDRHILCFTPYYEEERLAELFSNDEGDWFFSSTILNEDEEYIGSDSFTSLEHAKKYIEDLIEQHYADEISYYKHQLERFKG